MSTHAGGREIHLLPAGITERTTTIWPRFQHDPIRAALNPRRFLSQDDLNLLREMFPSAVGVRVFMSGFIVILFKTRADIEKSWMEDGPASEFGYLRLRYDIIEDEPTQKELFKGAAIAAKRDCFETSVALGVKIRFPSGLEAITVPTHGFVALRSIRTSPMLRVANWYALIKRKLGRFATLKRGSSEPAVGTPRHQPKGNSPLGKSVFLAGSAQEVCVLKESCLLSSMIICMICVTNFIYARDRSVPFPSRTIQCYLSFSLSLPVSFMISPWSPQRIIQGAFHQWYPLITHHAWLVGAATRTSSMVIQSLSLASIYEQAF